MEGNPGDPMIRFTIPISAKPVQTGGRRMRIRGGKPLFFKDRATAGYERAIIALAAAYRPVRPIQGAVKIELLLVLPRPRMLCRKKDPRGLLLAPKRPDLDNLCKGLLDLLTRAGFWRDDGQVTDSVASKRYAEIGGSARIEITIQELMPDPDSQLPGLS